VSSGPGFIWGYVYGSDQKCLTGAMVEIIDGPKAGERSDEQCNFDDGRGYQLRPPSGEVATLRASMPGYTSQELRLMIGNGGPPTNFTLQKE
jgi:hypothetical protein